MKQRGLKKVLVYGIVFLMVFVVFAGMPMNVNAEPGLIGLPFWDDFEDGNIDNWNDVSDTYGTIRIENGNLDGIGNYYLYLDSPPEPDNKAITILENGNNPNWNNYAFEFDTKIDFCSGGYAYINIFFNLQSTTDVNNGYHLIMQANQNTIDLIKRVCGDHWVVKRVPRTIDIDITYHVKVIVSNGNIQMYIDGNLVLDFYDSTFTYGSIGFGTNGAGAETVKSAFDNIKVTSFYLPTLIQLTTHSAADINPSFSPDGNNILFSTNRASSRIDIWKMAKDGSGKTPLTNSGSSQDCRPKWSPNNDKIVFEAFRPWGRGGSIWVMDTDGSNEKEIYYKYYHDAGYPSWTPDGSKIIFSLGVRYQFQDMDIYKMDPDGSNINLILDNSNHNHAPSYYPSGDKIVYISNPDGNTDIFIMDSDGNNQQQLTFTDANEECPSFSPDGTKIVYNSDEGGNLNIWMINADGTNPIKLTFDGTLNRYPAWSPDGKYIVFSSNRNGNDDIWLMDIEQFITKPPIAETGSDQTVNEGDVVEFDGSGSTGSIIPSPPTIDPNVVALWHMNKGYCTKIYDETEYDNDGILGGDGSGSDLPTWTTGKFGNALSFDGVDDYVEILDDCSIDLKSDFTIELWEKSTDPGDSSFIRKRAGGPGKPGYNIGIYQIPPDDGKIQAFLKDTDIYSETKINDGNYHYIVLVRSLNDLLLYVDGQLESCVTDYDGDLSNNEPLFIGSGAKIGGFCNAIIDEVVIWNKALTDQEILDYYNSNKEHFSEYAYELVEIVSYEWDFNNDGIYDYLETHENAPDGTFDGKTTHIYDDNGENIVTLKITDEIDTMDTDTCIITVNNVAPTIESIFASVEPVQVNINVILSGTFSDPGKLDSHTATINWGVGPDYPGEIDGYSVTGSYPYTEAGVYTLTLTVMDDDGGSVTEIFQYVVVYDPDGGFVTGGGWIDSPAGAYTADSTLTGKANFGFVSKYKKGADIPTGNTEFQFKVADLNFHSTSYDWLVVAGAKAKFKGTGTINGEGTFKFIIFAGDSAINGGGDTDSFRIKIWEEDDLGNENIIYDNDVANDGEDTLTDISGGSIVIHTSKK